MHTQTHAHILLTRWKDMRKKARDEEHIHQLAMQQHDVALDLWCVSTSDVFVCVCVCVRACVLVCARLPAYTL